MRQLTMILCAALIASATFGADEKPNAATVETTLSSAQPQIRMFAFDADPNTYFASVENPKASDHFTLVFDKPVALKSVSVATGRVNGADTVETGELQASEDGTKFEKLAAFENGAAKADGGGKKVKALRIQPSGDMTHPLAVREFTVDSDPAVVTFKYPVEIFVDCKDAPELKEWTEKTARICERAYQMICEELKSDGFTPKTVVTMTMKNDYAGVAETSGNRIKGSVKFFTQRKSDVGAMVHEMVHVAQSYRGRNPSWLVEGVADYIRNFKYEPEKGLRPVDPNKIKYDGSYQISARFLAFLTAAYDKDIVSKLNRAMREGKYHEELFKEYTKKTLPELDVEWKASLQKKA